MINSKGETYNLTGETVLFHTVSGLGVSKSNTYRQVGNRFNLVYVSAVQQEISGTITFFGEKPYDDYTKFHKFISVGGLTLYYSTTDDDWYMRDVDFSKLAKSEIEETGALSCSLSFTPKAPWYKKVVEQYHMVVPEGDNSAIFPFTWPVRLSDTNQIEITINSDSNTPSPVRLEMTGPLTNPKWVQYVNGQQYSSGELTLTVSEEEKLVVSNIGDTYEIAVYSLNDEYIKDVYQLSKFETKRFIWIVNGENKITVNGNVTDERISLKAEAFIYHDTV